MSRSAFALPIFVALVPLAVAQPAAPKPLPKPAAPSCVYVSSLLHYDATRKRLETCDWDGYNCSVIDVDSKAISLIDDPIYPPRAFDLNVRRDSICVGRGVTDCVKLGKKAVAAIAEDTRSDESHYFPRIQLSDDRQFAIAVGKAWDIKKDKALKVKAWAGGSMPAFASDFVGNLIVYSVSPCAGPCTESKIFTRAGKAVGKAFEGHASSFVKVNDSLWFAVTEYGGIVTIDATKKTAKYWNQTPQSQRNPIRSGLAFVLDGAPFFAAVVDSNEKEQLQITKLSADASTAGATFLIPLCQM